jgi:hypothetical protein
MRLRASSLFYSPSASLAVVDLSSATGAWPSSGQPSACSVMANTLFVAVSSAPTTDIVTVYSAAPGLPVSTAALTWTAIAALNTTGGGVTGFALSTDALSLYLAASTGGVYRATRASTSVVFSAFTLNTATTGMPASDVLVNANGLTVYVLTPFSLATIDMRGDWATAPLVNVTTAANDGTVFLGVALAPHST